MRKTEIEKTLVELIRAFGGMQHQCIKNCLLERRLDMVSNPKLLLFIRGSGGVISQKSIADNLGVAPPTITVSIKRMEKAGLVRKKINKNDQRENFVELTEKGLLLTDECIAAFGDMYAEMLRGFSDDEMQILGGFLRRLMKNMEELGAKNPGFIEEMDRK